MPKRKTTEVDALSTRQLSPNKCKASILHALKIKRPIFVWGGPGIGKSEVIHQIAKNIDCLLYTSPSPRDKRQSRMPSSA